MLKTRQEESKSGPNEQLLGRDSFRVGAAIDLLEQGEPLKQTILRAVWARDPNAMRYLRNSHI